MTDGEKPEQPWWRKGDNETFKAKLETLSTRELEMLGADMAGALVIIQTQLETDFAPGDASWHRRALRAQGLIAQRRNFVRVALTMRNESRRTEKGERRTALIEQSRALVEQGDFAGAIRLILDLLEGKVLK